VEKEKRAGGFWPKGHLPPPLWFRIERVREAGRDVAGRRLLPASQAPAAVGQWGKTTRASRGTDSPTYLGRCWRAEAVPWAATDWKVASLARRCPVLKQGEKVAVVVRGSPGSDRPLFIGGVRRFGQGYF
jgi:hypothetical protein